MKQRQILTLSIEESVKSVVPKVLPVFIGDLVRLNGGVLVCRAGSVA